MTTTSPTVEKPTKAEWFVALATNGAPLASDERPYRVTRVFRSPAPGLHGWDSQVVLVACEPVADRLAECARLAGCISVDIHKAERAAERWTWRRIRRVRGKL